MVIVRAAREAMRCRFELVLDGADEAFLVAASEEALDEIGLWEERLSRFRRDSIVARIERFAGRRAVPVDPETFEVFRLAQDLCERTGGAFDATWRTGGGLELDASAGTVALASPESQLDLGAIGKGFAIDRALDLLREHGVERALLHGGTSTVGCLGSPPDAAGWRVAFAGVDALDALELVDEACSVSAQHGRRLPDGSGHIRDPRAEDLAPERGPVVVRAPSAALADAWSTALLVDPGLDSAARDDGVVVVHSGPSPVDEAPRPR